MIPKKLRRNNNEKLNKEYKSLKQSFNILHTYLKKKKRKIKLFVQKI